MYTCLNSILLICFLSQSCAYGARCRKNNQEVKNLQEYVQLDTSNGKNLRETVAFLKRQAAELGLPMSVYYPDGKPICVMTWVGANPSLPSIMLNSHADVVPAEEKFWQYPPFSGYIDENCNIHGRGTRDAKDVTIQYIEAIRNMIKSNVTLLRTVHVTTMPDEETGGFQGMRAFIKTKQFRALNVGFALDEGGTSDDDILYVIYQDKRPWQMKFTVFGAAGHGSQLSSSTAMEKMYKLLTIIMKFREEQLKLSKELDPLDFGGYTTANVNIISGGSTTDVIPSEVSCVVDMRLATNAKIADVEAMVESWRTSVGNDTTLEFIRRDVSSQPTSLQCNPFWDAMKRTAQDLGIVMTPSVMPATSDMLPLRNIGIPALGFSTIVRTSTLLHGNEEYINVDIFLKGIDIYVAMIESLGNLPNVSFKNR